MERHFKIRKLIIYTGVFFLALSTIATIISSSSKFNAQVAEEVCVAEVDVNGDGLIDDNDCLGTGGNTETGYVECPVPEPVIDPTLETTPNTVSRKGVSTAKAASDTSTTIEIPPQCVCTEGEEPKPVPESVEQSKDAAVNSVTPLPVKIEQKAIQTKLDVEYGSVKNTMAAALRKVYNSREEAEREVTLAFQNSVRPSLDSLYFSPSKGLVSSHTATAETNAKSFFGYGYSTDPDRWGPTVSFPTNFNLGSGVTVAANTRIGGFSYQGNILDAGYVRTGITARWNILGDKLYATAGYDCEIGTATGNVRVFGEWRDPKVTWEITRITFRNPFTKKIEQFPLKLSAIYQDGRFKGELQIASWKIK